jgi:hypothetical protein
MPKLRPLALLALLIASVAAPAWAEPIEHLDTPGLTLYARVITSTSASVACALTEGTSNAVGRYYATDAALVSAGLTTAGTFPVKIFSGTPSTSANDTLRGILPDGLDWSGSKELTTKNYATGYRTVTWIGTSDNAETIIEAASAGTLIILEPGSHARNSEIAVPSGVDIQAYGATLTGDPGGSTASLLRVNGNNRWMGGTYICTAGSQDNGHVFGTTNGGNACVQTFVDVTSDGSTDNVGVFPAGSGEHFFSWQGGRIICDTWDGFSVVAAAGTYEFHGVAFPGRWKGIYLVASSTDINVVVDNCNFPSFGSASPSLNSSHAAIFAQSIGAGRITVSANDSSYAQASYWAIIDQGSTGAVRLYDAGGNDISASNVSLVGSAAVVATGTLVDGGITAAKIAADAIGASEIAANAIGSAEVADGTLTAAKLASDALTAAKFASDVTTELQSGLATGSAVSTMQADVTSILADTTVIGTPAGASLAADVAAKATQASVDTIDSNVDAILVDTGTDLPAAIDGIEAGATIDRADADMIAARIVASRGEFYPNRNAVWVLKRTDAGIGVVNNTVLTKRAVETRKLWIDLAGLLGRNEAIETIDGIEATEVTLTDDSEEISGNLVGFEVSGGSADDEAIVTLNVTTTEDQELEVEVTLNVVD